MSVSYHSAEWLSGANQSRSGGIGRRAWFRSMYPQGCGGSSPFFGTIYLSLRSKPLEIFVRIIDFQGRFDRRARRPVGPLPPLPAEVPDHQSALFPILTSRQSVSASQHFSLPQRRKIALVFVNHL